MIEHVKSAPASLEELQSEIIRLNKIITSLMNRAERNASLQLKGSEFELFQTAITLEGQVRSRTDQLEAALKENEKITRTLRENQYNYRLILENSPVSIHEINMAGRIVSMSKAGLSMHSLEDEKDIVGKFFLEGVCNKDQENVAELLEKALSGETCHFEFSTSELVSNSLKSCFVPIKDDKGNVKKIMGITEDITVQKKAQEHIRHLAFNDTLTDLPNRRLLHDRLKQAMITSTRNRLYGAVIFLDLDNFKPLNDTYGHEAGDLLLIEVAKRLTGTIRKMDTVARLGGDEFVVMLRELNLDKAQSIIEAGIVAEKIRLVLAKPYFLHRVQEDNSKTTVEHHCTSSIGVALFINHDDKEEDIIKCADKAMYKAKESGRNRVVFYDKNQPD